MPTTKREAKGWYEAVTGSDLAQGDLLQQVLLPFISSSDRSILCPFPHASRSTDRRRRLRRTYNRMTMAEC